MKKTRKQAEEDFERIERMIVRLKQIEETMGKDDPKWADWAREMMKTVLKGRSGKDA